MEEESQSSVCGEAAHNLDFDAAERSVGLKPDLQFCFGIVRDLVALTATPTLTRFDSRSKLGTSGA